MKNLGILERIKAGREGGRVTRCHTYGPYIGNYDVAQHTFNMLIMVDELYDGLEEDRSQLYQLVMWHDIHENWMGDIPHPAKQAFTQMAGGVCVAEDAINEKLQCPHFRHQYLMKQPFLSDLKEWVNWLDRLEVYMWALDQVYCGNLTVADIADSVSKSFFEERKKVPPNIWYVFESYTSVRLPRLPEFLEGEEKT